MVPFIFTLFSFDGRKPTTECHVVMKTNRKTNNELHRQTDRQTDRQTHKLADRQTGGRISR